MCTLGWRMTISDTRSGGQNAGLAAGGKSSDERDEKPPALSINPMLYLLSRNYGELAAEQRWGLSRVIPTAFLNVMFVVLGRSWITLSSLSHSLLLNIVAILYSYWRSVALNGEPKLLHFSLIWWMKLGVRRVGGVEARREGKFTLRKPRFP